MRDVILKNLPKGYEEGMQYGMIGYYVPHSIYPAGYHCDPRQPLPFACLASQKNYMSLYMMCVYGDGEDATRFREAWAKTGKKLDMGKSCIRFKKLDDLPLEVIGQAIKRMPVKKYIAWYEQAMKLNAERREGRATPKSRRQEEGGQEGRGQEKGVAAEGEMTGRQDASAYRQREARTRRFIDAAQRRRVNAAPRTSPPRQRGQTWLRNLSGRRRRGPELSLPHGQVVAVDDAVVVGVAVGQRGAGRAAQIVLPDRANRRRRSPGRR